MRRFRSYTAVLWAVGAQSTYTALDALVWISAPSHRFILQRPREAYHLDLCDSPIGKFLWGRIISIRSSCPVRNSLVFQEDTTLSTPLCRSLAKKRSLENGWTCTNVYNRPHSV